MENVVLAEEGENATLEWNIKKNNSAEIFFASLKLVGKSVIELYGLDGNTKQPSNSKADEIFPGRISAFITENSYLVTLQNLILSDTKSFRLEMSVRLGELQPKFDDSVINLQVKGMLHVICFIFCVHRQHR